MVVYPRRLIGAFCQKHRFYMDNGKIHPQHAKFPKYPLLRMPGASIFRALLKRK